MYRRLKGHFALRGWQGIPYGLINAKTGQTALLDGVTFQAASFCDGRTNLNSPLVLPAHRQAVDKLVQAGIVSECAADETLADWQKYRKSAGRFAASAHWSITGRCNLRCRHCYMSAPQAKYGELSTAQCLRIIDQIADANIGRVSLTGGEPLVRDDFWQLVDALLERRIVSLKSIPTVYWSAMNCWNNCGAEGSTASFGLVSTAVAVMTGCGARRAPSRRPSPPLAAPGPTAFRSAWKPFCIKIIFLH